MSGLTLAALITLVLACGVGALVARRVARRIRRTVALCRRRAVELRTRFLPPGPRRDAAVLRQRLGDELHSTTRMFTANPGSRIFQADAAPVLAEVLPVAAALDDALASIERFPDRAQQRAALASVTPQVEQLIDICYTARHTMLRTAALDLDRTLNSLSASVTHEATALDTYERAGRDLTI